MAVTNPSVWKPMEAFCVWNRIDDIDTTLTNSIGFTIRARHDTNGMGTFIYLPGVANTVVGSLVTYDVLNQTTTLSPNTAHLAQPVAVSMSANTLTTSYGWYQVEGVAVIKKTAVKVSPGVPIYQSGTAGRIFPTQTSGKQIVNAVTLNTATVASATSTVNVLIQYPFAQGQVV